MFDFISDKDFLEAISKKDYSSLRSFLLLTITQETNKDSYTNKEIKKMIDIFKKDVPEIFQKKVYVPEEYTLPENKWNYDYFKSLLFNLRYNFCPERIDEVEKVRKYLQNNNLFPHKSSI